MKLPLPGLPSFDYMRAESLEQACGILMEQDGEARALLGGTDILVQMRDRACSPRLLVDLKHLPGMGDIEFDAAEGLRVGAGATMNALAEHEAVSRNYPLLVEAASSVASYQLRNRATVGGNLCNASPAADMAPATLVLEASLVVASVSGERVIPAGEFFLGPGETALKPGELLTRIDYPLPPNGWYARYLKLGRNAEGDLAIVGVASLGFPDDAAPSGYRFRIALASVAPTPIRVREAEDILAAGPMTDETMGRAVLAAEAAAAPIDDARASARYRKAMVSVIARRAMGDVLAALRRED